MSTDTPALTVMIVDDSSLMRQMLRDIIAQAPHLHIVAEASDGAQALEKIERHSPDIVLLDIEMPVLDGIGFLREVRLRSDARIIVISSVAQPGAEKAMQALELGAHDIVPKPSGVVSLDMSAERGRELMLAIRDCTVGW